MRTFFFFFCFSLLKKDGNLFWVYQNGNFLQGKSISRREKNQEKWLRPLRKICLLRPCFFVLFGVFGLFCLQYLVCSSLSCPLVWSLAYVLYMHSAPETRVWEKTKVFCWSLSTAVHFGIFYPGDPNNLTTLFQDLHITGQYNTIMYMGQWCNDVNMVLSVELLRNIIINLFRVNRIKTNLPINVHANKILSVSIFIYNCSSEIATINTYFGPSQAVKFVLKPPDTDSLESQLRKQTLLDGLGSWVNANFNLLQSLKFT